MIQRQTIARIMAGEIEKHPLYKITGAFFEKYYRN